MCFLKVAPHEEAKLIQTPGNQASPAASDSSYHDRMRVTARQIRGGHSVRLSLFAGGGYSYYMDEKARIPGIIIAPLLPCIIMITLLIFTPR